MEFLDSESSKVAIPIRGAQVRKLNAFERFQDRLSGLVGKGRGGDRDRGNYVPLQTVDGGV